MITYRAICHKRADAPKYAPDQIVIKLGNCASINSACNSARQKCPINYYVFDVSRENK